MTAHIVPQTRASFRPPWGQWRDKSRDKVMPTDLMMHYQQAKRLVSARFSLLDFSDGRRPSVIYLEALTGARYLEGQRHVTAYRKAIDILRKLSIPIEEFR